MSIKIALVGNPNSGKTTLFNSLTGANQYVGNWPGVTVEKKEGKIKKNKDVILTDLPGIYSLSPYSMEEVVARSYLVDERPDAIINIIDGTNLERNLYLTTQILEMNIPTVIAINMMDIVEKRGDKIDIEALSAELGCEVIEVSALRGKGTDAIADAAISAASGAKTSHPLSFSRDIEVALSKISAIALAGMDEAKKRFYAVKLFERDEKIIAQLSLSKEKLASIESLIASIEKNYGDDSVAVLTNERYEYITDVAKKTCKKKSVTLTVTDKIDRIVTNRFLALPIFVFVMWFVYFISIGSIGDWTVGFMNDTLFGEWIVPAVSAGLENIGCAEWLVSLIADGIVGGVGAVLGFVPQMLILFLLLALLEDCGYMSRVAFIMDRVFRKLGLSGKSFIPMLVATGCGVPGIMASRTIEQERDRKMTIMTTGFIPCGAKMPIVGMIAGALFGGSAWIATSAYFVGIGAVIVSGLILKKTKPFEGKPAPFVMELPSYHLPVATNILRTTWERGWSFIKRAGTVILAASVIIWVLNSLSFEGGFHYITEDRAGASILEIIGTGIAFLFRPLGFGSWQAAVATVLGLVAKEEVVGVFGSLSSMADADLAFELVDAADSAGLGIIGLEFFGGSRLSGFSFLVFNLLCAPCFAAMGAIRREMNNAKWTAFAISYMCVFAYAVSLMIYQLGMLFTGNGNVVGSIFAFITLAVFVFMIVRPDKLVKSNKKDALLDA